MSWKPEVLIDNEWSRNGLVFETKTEAEANARNLMSRWLLVCDTRAVEVDKPANHRWTESGLEAI